MNTIGGILKDLRKDNNLSLASAAIKTGIGRTQLSEFERGVRMPDKQQIYQFADLYEAPHQYLHQQWLSDKLLATLQGEDGDPRSAGFLIPRNVEKGFTIPDSNIKQANQ